MTNKALIKIIVILAVISLISTLYSFFIYNEIVDYISMFSTNIFSLLGLYLLFYNSTIKKTVFWRMLNISFALLIVGAWMKIMHLSSANTLVTIALSSIAIIYFMYFIKKRKKSHLDFLKLSWILSTYIIANLVFLHVISKDYVFISRTLFCITLLDFCLIEYGVNKPNLETNNH